MTMQESHTTLRVKIESKPDGGFVSVSENPQLNFEGATREEVENKVRQQLVQILGPQVAGMLPTNFSDPSFVRENVATPDKIKMNIKKSFNITVNKSNGTTSEFSHTFGSNPSSHSPDFVSSSSSSEENFGPVRRTGDGSAAMLMLRILIAGIVLLAILFLIRRELRSTRICKSPRRTRSTRSYFGLFSS